MVVIVFSQNLSATLDQLPDHVSVPLREWSNSTDTDPEKDYKYLSVKVGDVVSQLEKLHHVWTRYGILGMI